jgi:hypothetical protein
MPGMRALDLPFNQAKEIDANFYRFVELLLCRSVLFAD